MNKVRRQAIAKMEAVVRDLMTEVQETLDEEQEYIDNIPEALQDGEKYSVAGEAINALECVIGNLEEAADNLLAAQG